MIAFVGKTVRQKPRICKDSQFICVWALKSCLAFFCAPKRLRDSFKGSSARGSKHQGGVGSVSGKSVFTFFGKTNAAKGTKGLG